MSSDHGDDSSQGGNDSPQAANDTPLVYNSYHQGGDVFGKPAPSSPANDANDDHSDCSGVGHGGNLLGNLDLDTLLGGSVSAGPGLIDVHLDGETSSTGALLSIVAGGEGLGHMAVDLNTDAIDDMGLLGGAPSCLLGNLDVLDNVLCDGILT